jgi:type II secretion system protein J
MKRISGFTMLEILVTIALTSIIVLFCYQVFRQITQTQDRARPDRSRDLVAEVFLDRFEREVIGTVLLIKPEEQERLEFPWLFIGEDRVFGSNDSDGLRFITQSPARAPGSVQGALRTVSYGIETAADDAERLDLIRVEEALPERLQKQIQLFEGQAVLEDVVLFSLRFQDEESGEWHDSWDSTQLETNDALPVSLEVALQLYEEDPDGTRIPGRPFQRTIELPVRPISPGRDEVEDDSECEGDTVQECLAYWEADIEDSGRSERMAELAAAAGPGCWYQEEPSEAMNNLYEAFIESVPDIDDAREACP